MTNLITRSLGLPVPPESQEDTGDPDPLANPYLAWLGKVKVERERVIEAEPLEGGMRIWFGILVEEKLAEKSKRR